MSTIIEEVTKLYPIAVDTVYVPNSIEDIQQFLGKYPGKISIGGGRYSMGGQTAIEGGAQIDMRSMNRILDFDPEGKTIKIETGIRWRDIQDHIDPYDLSIMTMQTYSNFTVGGALSVNCHGRYIGFGPIILSVLEITVILADGNIIVATPDKNSEIFYGAIGGYGGIGIIVDATLKLQKNEVLERVYTDMDIANYGQYFRENIRDNKDVIFHNADMYPPLFQAVRTTSWQKSSKEATTTERLIPRDTSYPINQIAYSVMAHCKYGKWIRQHILDPIVYRKTEVHNRNYEASYDVAELEPKSRKKDSYVLEEYFCPADRIDEFIPKMREIFSRHDANIINISIRHALPDSGSVLAWAQEEVFAFVVYYNQETDESARKEVAVWTRELIDAVISVGGRYYLPYQLHATLDQLKGAYGRWDEYSDLKKKYDPTGKLSNSLLEKYYFAKENKNTVSESRFKTVYGSIKLRDKFYIFLQNIFHIAPTNTLHTAIGTISEAHDTDQDIYLSIQSALPGIKPVLGDIRYGLPALFFQKKELAKETKTILGNTKDIDGYLEIGGAGRYTKPLQQVLNIRGDSYLISDEPIDRAPTRILERGQMGIFARTRALSYTPSDFDHIPDASVDLITIFIGLHHCPVDMLDAYIEAFTGKLRTGGKLVLRDHNVLDPDMHAFVALAHDIYNAGTGISWEANEKELRNFQSVAAWKNLIQSHGYETSGKDILQENDPTDNTLMLFTRI